MTTETELGVGQDWTIHITIFLCYRSLSSVKSCQTLTQNTKKTEKNKNNKKKTQMVTETKLGVGQDRTELG